jgi:hypothetical protein
MRVFARAIVSAAFVISLATPTAVAEVTVNVLDLRRACMAPRSFAMVELFGANYTPEQANILDSRLEQELSGKTPQALADAYQAFERNAQSRHPDADRYAQCIYGERLRQLDPNADLQAVRRGEYTPAGATAPANSAWSAAMTRRDSNTAAGSAVLAQSADPALRAARARENAILREQAERRIAERRAESEAFWGAVLQAATIAVQTYVAVEQAQAEADAAEAQARADAYARAQAQQGQTAHDQQVPTSSPSQQTTSPCAPPGTVYYYGSANCSGESGSDRTHNPANDGTNCVRVVANPGNWGSGRWYFQNGCGWPVEVAWDRNSEGRFTSQTSIALGGHYPTGFAQLPSPFPYLACKKRPEIGADMYVIPGSYARICGGPAA